MKPRKIDKKLSLNKKTVANLSENQQNKAKGGLPYTYHCCGTRGECNSNYTMCGAGGVTICPNYTVTYCCCVISD
jgi:hypothetical protein